MSLMMSIEATTENVDHAKSKKGALLNINLGYIS